MAELTRIFIFTRYSIAAPPLEQSAFVIYGEQPKTRICMRLICACACSIRRSLNDTAALCCVLSINSTARVRMLWLRVRKASDVIGRLRFFIQLNQVPVRPHMLLNVHWSSTNPNALPLPHSNQHRTGLVVSTRQLLGCGKEVGSVETSFKTTLATAECHIIAIIWHTLLTH